MALAIDDEIEHENLAESPGAKASWDEVVKFLSRKASKPVTQNLHLQMACRLLNENEITLSGNFSFNREPEGMLLVDATPPVQLNFPCRELLGAGNALSQLDEVDEESDDEVGGFVDKLAEQFEEASQCLTELFCDFCSGASEGDNGRPFAHASLCVNAVNFSPTQALAVYHADPREFFRDLIRIHLYETRDLAWGASLDEQDDPWALCDRLALSESTGAPQTCAGLSEAQLRKCLTVASDWAASFLRDLADVSTSGSLIDFDAGGMILVAESDDGLGDVYQAIVKAAESL